MREVRDIDSENRGRREIEAYASGKHRENRRSLYTRFSHVYSNPNSQRQTDYFEEFVRGKAQNRDVLDVGCGTGWSSQKILEMGPRSVDGIDISAEALSVADKNIERYDCRDRVTLIESDLFQVLQHLEVS